MSNPLYDFSFFKLLKHGLTFIWEQKRECLMMAALPSLVIMAITVIDVTGVQALTAEQQGDITMVVQSIQDNMLGIFAMLLIQMVVTIMFAVGWFRRWLLPNGSESLAQALSWSGEKTKMFFACLLAMGAMIIFVAITTTIGGLLNLPAGFLGFLVFIAIMYGMGRISMLFPAIAIGDPITVKDSIDLTKGVGHYLAGLILIAGMVGTLGVILMSAILQLVLASASLLDNILISSVLTFAITLATFLVTGWQVTCVAGAYSLLTEKESRARLFNS